MSSVPGVLAALNQLAVNRGHQSMIGNPVADDNPANDFVAIAWSGEDSAAVTESDTTGGLAPRMQEEFTVINQIVAWDGSAEILSCVSRAYAMLDGFAADILADKTLGNQCRQATLTESELRAEQTGSGAMATVTFSVQVQSQRILTR